MGAKRIVYERGFHDYRLTLVKVGHRVISTLSSFFDSDQDISVRYESEPDWALIDSGIAVLQEPEKYSGKSVEALGEELGRVVFGPDILNQLIQTLEVGQVRLWLRATGDLVALPWETCSFKGGEARVEGVLSMHPGLSLIRELSVNKPIERQRSGPIRVLVVWADPSSRTYPHLPGIEKEVRSVMRGLSTPECRRFEVDELPFATPSGLARSLKNRPPDIVHFVGHGDLAPTGSVLVLDSGKPNEEALLHADDFAAMLEQAQVQMVVLSGCLTSTVLSDVTPHLGQRGALAVVAMQAPIHDASAGLFARALYGSLGTGETIEDAVLEGRLAIRGTGNDWAVPVLMRAPFECTFFEPDFDFDFTPDVPQRRHNLTIDDRPFIGRHLERMEIRDRLCIKRQRLVTITGMGGMGKTRLGKQVSAELLDDFPDGVWMIECDTLDSRDQLLGAAGSVLGCADGRSNVEDSLVQHLVAKKLLLFFDCFERLVEHADILDNILRHCPDCQILVSSRIVLGLAREYEYRLSPMALKKRGVEASDGVSLFMEAASHAVNSFEPTVKERGMVRELCQELEGVPLALVLAAGRLRHLTLTELLEQVRLHPLDVLKRKGGAKDKQADLYRVVASSFLLLGTRECGLLDKLGLFVGGFTADDAAEICNWSKIDTLQGLSTLRDHSLLQVESKERTRYKLLDTVREFLEQLPRDEAEIAERDACAMRHAERYLRIAEHIGRLTGEGRWTDGISLLWTEIGNLRAACKYSDRTSHYDLTRKYCNSLARCFYELALHEDFEHLARSGMAAADSLCDLELEARLLGLLGAEYAGKKDEAAWRDYWTRRIAVCESIGDIAGCTDAMFDIAWESFVLGNVDEAHGYLRRATELAKKASHPGLLSACFVADAQMQLKTGNLQAAMELAECAALEAAKSSDKRDLLYVSQHLTSLYGDIGDVTRSRSTCIELLNLSLEVQRPRGTAWGLLKLAESHEQSDELELAALCLICAMRHHLEFTIRQSEKSKILLGQFLKRHGEMESFVQKHKKTPWTGLVTLLPYVRTSLASSSGGRN